jgi:branched-chain amino acid transport system substrate-binding protein
VDIFTLAKEEPSLFHLKWYGSDGAQRALVIKEAATAEFALAVGYPNPMMGMDRSREDVWAPVATRIKEMSGVTPDAFALCAYDALIVAAKALQQAGGYANAETLKRAVVMVANSSTGLTGPSTLSAAGDRTLAAYDFWSVKQGPDGFGWFLTATYKPGSGTATGTIQRVAAP